MKITIEFSTDNAAFSGNSDADNAEWALRHVSKKAARGDTGGHLVDVNGNRVGFFDIDVPEPSNLDAFREAWEGLADECKCDSIDGSQYTRVWQEWCDSSQTDMREFIIERANAI